MSVSEPDCLIVSRSRRKAGTGASRIVHGVRGADQKALVPLLGAEGAAFALACGFTGRPGQLVLVPDVRGVPVGLFGVPEKGQRDPYLFGALAQDLPAGDWQVSVPADIARMM